MKKELTIDEIFDVVDNSLDDDIAYQAIDKVYIVNLGTETYYNNGDLASFIGNQVTAEDIGYNEEDDVYYLDDCEPYVGVIINADGSATEIDFEEYRKRFGKHFDL